MFFSMDPVESTEHIRHYLLQINEQNGNPVVLKHMISDWSASSWQPNNLESVFGDDLLDFRIGNTKYDGRVGPILVYLFPKLLLF
jgi:hypothetical protein